MVPPVTLGKLFYVKVQNVGSSFYFSSESKSLTKDSADCDYVGVLPKPITWHGTGRRLRCSPAMGCSASSRCRKPIQCCICLRSSHGTFATSPVNSKRRVSPPTCTLSRKRAFLAPLGHPQLPVRTSHPEISTPQSTKTSPPEPLDGQTMRQTWKKHRKSSPPRGTEKLSPSWHRTPATEASLKVLSGLHSFR